MPADASKSGSICLNFLRAAGCRRKNCHFGHYDATNPVPKNELERLYKGIAGSNSADPGDLDESKIRAGNMSTQVLMAALRPPGSPRGARPPKKNKKDDAALIAAVREVLTGISAPVATGAIQAAPVQATAFSLLTPPPPPPSKYPPSVPQVTEQQRNVFQALSDKEFRDHFAKIFSL